MKTDNSNDKVFAVFEEVNGGDEYEQVYIWMTLEFTLRYLNKCRASNPLNKYVLLQNLSY